MEMLQTENLTKQFGGLTAVDKVNLRIRANQLTSIIGPNGAGKTTLFNLLTGLLPSSGGRTFFEGKEITGLPSHRIVKVGIARSFQIVNSFMELSLFENIRLSVQAEQGHGFEMLSSIASFGELNDRTQEIVKVLGLEGKEESLVQKLSYGDKRVLEIGIALASRPRLLLLDEPTSGLASRDTGRITEFIKDLATRLTIAVIEHDMNLVLTLSDHIVVLHQGQIIAEGPPQTIRENDMVQEAYLGGL